ncbi:MAG: phage major capsid protein [Deltaproteobacteria bacterium]|nr:MAG: phage major capsid protein [Deltaproteobacteria bacterium]
MGEQTLDSLHTELKKVHEEFKKVNDRKDSENALNKDQLEKMNKDMNDLSDSIDKKLKDIESKLNRPERQNGGQGVDEKAQKKAQFFEYCRKTDKGFTPEQLKLMTVGDDTTGGYLAPKEFINDMIADIVLFSNIRSIARVRTTGRKAVEITKKTQNTAAAWGSEAGTEDETQNLNFGMLEVPIAKLAARSDITDEDLADPDYSIESELRMDWAEQFGVAEGAAFVNGDGVGKPKGFLQETLTTVTSGTAATVTADELITTFYTLKDAYAKNATWVMQRLTEGAVRKLKNSTTDEYLWQPGLQANSPSLLLGRPILNCTDMPAIASLSKSIVLGDFRAGYGIWDRMSLSVLRDPYTSASTGTVRIFARKRVGGRVLKTEAFVLNQMKTS